MSDWVRVGEVRCYAKPAAVSFRRVPTRESPGYDFYRSDRFLCEKMDGDEHVDDVGLLWHHGSLGNEPLLIDCVADPLALSVQATSEYAAILDLFTVDRSRNLWHRRFSPPPEASFIREARRGCLALIFDWILSIRLFRGFIGARWHSLGLCESNPAACSRTDGAVFVAVRREQQVFVHRLPPGRASTEHQEWEGDWRVVAGADSTVDPAIAIWSFGDTRVFTVTPSGELYMHMLDRPGTERTLLGRGFAQFPPAIANGMVFALTETGQVMYRTPDVDVDWRIVGDETHHWSTGPVVLYYQPSDPPGDPVQFSHFAANAGTFVFVRDTFRHLWTTRLPFFSTIWSEWQDLDGSHTAKFCAVQVSRAINLYAREENKYLARMQYGL